MNFDIQTILCIGVILISIIATMLRVIHSDDLDDAIEPILSGFATIIAFFIIIGFYEKISLETNNILNKYFSGSIVNSGISRVLSLVLVFFLIKFIIETLLKIINSLSLSNAIKKLNINKGFLIIFSTIFGAIRGMIGIVILCITLILYNSIASGNRHIDVLDNLAAYNKLERIIDESKIQKVSNGILESVSNNKVYYYNGVTIDEGVKSNNQIDNKAVEITKKDKTDREKAKSIYTWVGSNIVYDDAKATQVMSQASSNYESGAIPAFRDKKGICFDYACLYTAMVKAIGLKSRVVIGEAFNGNEYISHSWNQVYLKDEGKWVNVDSTFYPAGEYFDSENFNKEYRTKNIAGEF
ncbi:transglutaminase-like domain-containing protein [Clostridium sp. SHJSY1]|uniref:transglutaminase-like domain-containing protein n=1 Tax=Clostridium sp. SHJSY1 TaxID=2942483 RepID=UPI0028758437|nr:transglutaminase-like domain-containing protein [Clostridium sp. SHJSY1]MDS0526355.1 transglutaminase-like domain-containing protein [Clostridium sp. SHJSY1]